MIQINEQEFNEIMKEVIDLYLTESKHRVVSIRGGKKLVHYTADPGQKMVNGKLVRMNASERMKRRRGARRGVRKRVGKQSVIQRKRERSIRKRDRMGI